MTSSPLSTTPRRIAVVGDWHGSHGWATKAIRHAWAEGADLIIHLGDYGYSFDQAFLAGVEYALAETGLRLLFVDGNHERFPTLYAYLVGDDGLRQITSRVWHLPRGIRWEWDGVRFLACGGAYSVDRQWRVLGESWWTGEEITDADVRRCIDGGPADILIAHDTPSGYPIPTIDDRTGPPPFPPAAIIDANIHRRQLRRIVDAVQPHAIWHGHYHHAYTRTVEFGYGPVTVTGLDCDGTTLVGNVQIVELADLALEAATRTEAAT